MPSISKKSLIVFILKFILLVSLGTAAGLGVTLSIQDWLAVRELREFEAHQLGPGVPPTPENFFPGVAVPAQPVLSGFEIIPSDKAAGKIDDDELVIGVAIDGESRAYPINMLEGPGREIVNDELAGRAIAATW